MNSLYIGKSYIAGDGDNTISQLSYNSTSSAQYFGDLMPMLILAPFSMSKSAIDYNQVHSPNYLYYVSTRSSTNNSTSDSAMMCIKFAVNSIALGKNLVKPLFNVDVNSYLYDYNYYVGIGSIVKYYDVEKGIWVIETMSRKEVKTTGSSVSNVQGVYNKPWEVIIGTNLKPNLLKLSYTSGDEVQCIIDLKTGNENNVNLE